MLKSNLCDYSSAYIHVKRTKTIPNIGPAAAQNHVEKKKKLKIVLHLLTANVK